MGSHSFVKSESWLDISRIAQQEEQRQQNDQHSERRPTQSANRSQARRRPMERALSLEPTVRNSWSNNQHQHNSNKQEHLLIRLRQQSFLARSNSTTLSSNLSRSVDLDESLVDHSKSINNPARENRCESSANELDGRKSASNKPTHQTNSTKRELSLGLKSFRDRFERRWRQMRHSHARSRTYHLDWSDFRRRPRDASPFARSWSSLSEQVSSRLTNIGHACKSLLYECQKPECEIESDERRAGEFGQSGANRLSSPMPASSRILSADEHDNDRLDVSKFRRRLTSQWVSQQYEAQRNELSSGVENNDQNLLIGPANRLAAPGDDCKPQPRSVSRRESSSHSSQGATYGKGGAECKLADQISATAENGAIELASPLTHRSHSTSSSMTLVSVTNKPQQKQTTHRTEYKRNSLPVERILRPQANSSSNTVSSSSSVRTTMSSNKSNQSGGKLAKKPPQATRTSPATPVATSDYWSSVKSELAPPMVPVRDHNQDDPHNLQPNSMLAMASDQDYYLEVATAADFQQKQQQQRQMMMLDLQQQHLFDDQLAQEPAFLTAEPDDYDDYAVPADESCCRLERSQVELVQLIGEGQKGYVFLGKLQSKNGQSIIDVAIKTLKFETEQLIERLMNEAAMMKQLEHPHIIKFIGMCPETPALIAMELAKFGEIKHYLRLNRQLIKCSQLVLFSFQISTALSYLESKNYVHRDVAARNVLVCSHNCVKLADFGLSRNLQPNCLAANSPQNSYNQHGRSQNDLLSSHQNQQDLYVAAPRVKLPVRWLAPESLVFRRFTSASDVWMFSVCTWEFFQLGQVRPWAHLRNNQVLAAIESGQRLARPEVCPERLYQLMLKSWSYAPVQRPKFREIKQCIWSIYLSERTREQLELERLEHERQQRLMLIQQQHLQQAQVPLLATNNKQLSLLACDGPRGNEQRPVRASDTSPNTASHQARSNHTPSSNYSSTLTTTTDTEQMISPCSSAFNSMAREATERETDEQKPRQQQHKQVKMSRSSALKTAISRYEQRQSPVGGAAHQRHHLLQKQRSQGTIGMSTSSYFEGDETTECNSPEFNRSKGARRSDQIQPLDDEALESARRNARRAGLGERHSVVPTNKLVATRSTGRIGVNEDSESEIEESDVEEEGALWTRAHRFVSASPALTADAGSQSRVVSIEPAYDGVFPTDHHNHTRALLMPANDQIAMLRNNFDPSDSSRLSPHLMSSPALTSSNSPTRPSSWRSTPTASNMDPNNNFNLHQRQQQASVLAQRKASGKKPRLDQSNHNRLRVSPQPDQLGQMLQALRITPMKAELTSWPEQNIRVLQREEKRPTVTELERPLERQDSSKRSSIAIRDQVVESPPQQLDGQTKQLMLHQRLLGRIRPSSSSLSPGSDPVAHQTRYLSTSFQQQQRRPKSQVVRDKSDVELASFQRGINSRLPHQNKSVEAVDHSLQILESLMLGSDANNPDGPATSSSLPRRSHR